MKKLLLAFAFLTISLSTFSQVTFKPGIRAGVNLASVSNTNLDSRTAFYAGIFGELKLGGVYAMQPEITYNQQGGKDYELDYVSIRIANKFYVLKDRLPIYAVIAPGFDVELGGNSSSYSGAYGASVAYESDISVSGGIGYDFPFGLGVEARYKKGVIDVVNTNNPEKRTNSVIQIGVSYKFFNN
ncbi:MULTISPECIES: outer membrane beta-barrel protein [Bizionia]|uniref:PorT family protein n=1 Tax=Bizionia algoritergicola TaxID=291187 RepID=A0A5D0R379_9FLAO|nr:MULTISPECIES: outer membrane beta-barrel protein [Bizionia]OBX24365.1 hypothetical protein BAA08_00800 [Bizionia sp. APA-3]TYB75286.1 PorT family protein [Bizionia algoritergicola]